MSVILAVATRPCVFCAEVSIVEVTPDRYRRWQSGEPIQTVWPEWTPAQRELLITGTHPVCWNSAFPPDDAFINDDGVVPTCDLCGSYQSVEGDDWNGDTGNHHSCEESR